MRTSFINFQSLLILFFLFVIGCARQTQIVDSWRSPDVQLEKGHFQKFLTVAMLNDEINRRKAEDQLTRLMPGQAVPSYTIFEQLPDQADEPRMMERMAREGFDGVLIMRLVRVEDDSTFVPGSYHGPYTMDAGQVINSPTYVSGTYPSHYAGVWSYYSHAYPTYSYYSEPGYFDVDRYYYFETNLYDVEQNVLVWSSVTSTYEPTSISETTSQVADAVHKEMLDMGFISK